MFIKKVSAFGDKFDAVIGENARFEGNIYCDGSVRIDGQVDGSISSSGGDVLIGPKSHVKGNITANNLQLAGTVEGNINVDGMLRILSTGRLYGDIRVKNFVSDEGAIFQGKCIMIESPQNQPSDEGNVATESSQAD